MSTGISKGGQCTYIHRSLYPNDVDGSIAYVAPLNFEREDPRIYTFLENVGTVDERNSVLNFQRMCFERSSTLISLLKQQGEDFDYTWDFDVRTAFEYYVLEYSFAYWQWGPLYRDESIPDKNASDEIILNHLLAISGVSFF